MACLGIFYGPTGLHLHNRTHTQGKAYRRASIAEGGAGCDDEEWATTFKLIFSRDAHKRCDGYPEALNADVANQISIRFQFAVNSLSILGQT
jgi:hypothetical protein